MNFAAERIRIMATNELLVSTDAVEKLKHYIDQANLAALKRIDFKKKIPSLFAAASINRIHVYEQLNAHEKEQNLLMRLNGIQSNQQFLNPNKMERLHQHQLDDVSVLHSI